MNFGVSHEAVATINAAVGEPERMFDQGVLRQMLKVGDVEHVWFGEIELLLVTFHS